MIPRLSSRRRPLWSASFACALAGAFVAFPSQAQTKYEYPKAHTVEQIDEYHGVKVADPYRWLENPDAPESVAWIEAQNRITQAYLGGVPERSGIQARLTKLWDYEKFGMPFKEGGKYFYSYNTGLQAQSVYFVADRLGGEGRVLLDPNTLSKDGTVALAGMAVSDDGKYLAYGIAEAGSDWNTWKVREIATGKDTSDEVRWAKFSGASWAKDGSGFFYSRFDEPQEGDKLRGSNFYHKLYFHKLGTPQSQDILVYHETSEDKKDWGFYGSVSEDGQYLVINVSKGTDPKNRFYFKEIGTSPDPKALADGSVVKLLDAFDASYNFVGNDGPTFFFVTDLKAPKSRLIAININHPNPEDWKEIVKESDATLTGVGLVGNLFHCTYLRDAKSEIKVYDLAGAFVRDVQLPTIGTAGGFGGKKNETETFYSFTSYTYPPTIYRYDTKTGESTIYKQAKVDFKPDEFETKQVFYTSKDGTKVPMFIVHKKGTKLDGSNPTLLYGYGGFNISMTPSFSVGNLVWVEMGGVYAVACLRGGGEYGEEWHQAGTKTRKQNVFDDFIAAAEYLIKEKYTTNKKLGIMGGSNGGLLVGACMTQRPDLFGACLPIVGVLDMLRFHKFTIGHAWRSDYGAADGEGSTPEQFKALYAYSPLHNIKKGTCYPPTMVMTADHDDRVVPAHSFKFAAALQAAQGCDNPALIRIETRAGHGAGKPTAKVIEDVTDRWAFLVRALDMKPQGLAALPADNKVILNVEGMTCEICVAKVHEAIMSVKGVAAADVSLKDNKAFVTLAEKNPAKVEDLIAAIAKAEKKASLASR
jgi:prolyl oligopeptidase